ncbi:TauD/TfdA family dioxygenase [Streptomyces sp. NBC_00237]|uniref:TauD/TfdA family dioxygenase n=1 Tax=Streptomyces sp. NBC_00237 TaxID=2975687 RepID=UPI00224D3BEC|nr:TauD/TfdA family dioxygenase [Streptomyces sp. NBC_00237]MCX5202706.1 TauD/TfdA family dioxygenase [Streptomyces sp. NBC_00237]
MTPMTPMTAARLPHSAPPPSSEVVLDAPARSQLEALAHTLLTVADGRIDTPQWVGAVRHAWADAPASLRRALTEYRRDSGTSGALLLRGLPIDPGTVPDTPTVPGSVQRTATLPAAVLMLVAHGLGDPVSYRPEKSGALVQDVVPVPGLEDFQGNAGSTRLTFHVENAFHEHRPDHVLLLCLRADHEREAELRLCSSRQVLPRLGESSLAVLRGPHFETSPPPSFATDGDRRPHAVLAHGDEDPVLRIDEAATRPLDARAATALAELSDLFQESYRAVRLAPGDLAVVDNRVTVHGRSAFVPRYDGRDRWLQRTFVAADLRRSRSHRPGDGQVLTR